MFTLDVRADFAPLVAKLNAIKQGLGDQVIVPALNDTARDAKTQMVRGIAREYAIKQSDVRDLLPLRLASRKGKHFEATLFGNPSGRAKRAVNLIRFLQSRATLTAYRRKGTRGTDVLRFQVRKGKTIAIPGTFILNVPGHPVFKRTGTGRKGIAPAYVVGVPQMFETKAVQIPVQKRVPVEFSKNFDKQMRRFLSKVK